MLSRGNAKVAELVDALDLGSSGATRESSSLFFRTTVVRIGRETGLRGFFVSAIVAEWQE